MARPRAFILGAAIVVGALAVVASGLFAVAGAGIAGTPFQGTERENFLLLLTLVFGPLAVLPCALVDVRFPGKGGLLLCALALTDAAAIAAFEQREWGFAMHDAALGSLCLAAPAFLIGSLLFLTAGENRSAWSASWVGAVAIASSVAAFYLWQVGRDGIEIVLHLLAGGTV